MHCVVSTCRVLQEGSAMHCVVTTCRVLQEGSAMHCVVSTCRVLQEGSAMHCVVTTCRVLQEGSDMHCVVSTCRVLQKVAPCIALFQHVECCKKVPPCIALLQHVECCKKVPPCIALFQHVECCKKVPPCIALLQHGVLQEGSAIFELLLEKDGSVKIHEKNIQVLVTEMFKIKHNIAPVIMNEILPINSSHYNFRNINDFKRDNIRSVYYGENSLRYVGPILWSLVPIEIQNCLHLRTVLGLGSLLIVHVDFVKHIFRNLDLYNQKYQKNYRELFNYIFFLLGCLFICLVMSLFIWLFIRVDFN